MVQSTIPRNFSIAHHLGTYRISAGIAGRVQEWTDGRTGSTQIDEVRYSQKNVYNNLHFGPRGRISLTWLSYKGWIISFFFGWSPKITRGDWKIWLEGIDCSVLETGAWRLTFIIWKNVDPFTIAEISTFLVRMVSTTLFWKNIHSYSFNTIYTYHCLRFYFVSCRECCFFILVSW